MPPATITAVVDTNLLVRALMRGAVPGSILAAWHNQKFALVTSDELLAELFEVVARPIFQSHFSSQDMADLGRLIFERANVVAPATRIHRCRDPKDDILLDAAIAGEVQFLVSGDKDLLDGSTLTHTMQDQYRVLVVSAAKFLVALLPND